MKPYIFAQNEHWYIEWFDSVPNAPEGWNVAEYKTAAQIYRRF